MLRGFGSYIGVLLGIGIIVFMSSNLNWSRKNSWNSLVVSDAKGYVAYLPATFIYQDPNFGFFDEMERGKYYVKNHFYDYRREAHGKYVNKYFIGVAVCSSPFFLLGHAWALLTGGEADGYSKPYYVFLHIGSICYLALGLFFLVKLLQLYQISSFNSTLTALALLFATNLSYYATEEPLMSHVFNFCFVALFLYSTKKYILERDRYLLLWASFFFGMVVILRPVNGLILLFIPFLAGSWGGVWDSLKSISLGGLLGGIGIALGVLALQLGMYYWQTGQVWVYSYVDEGFNFSHPHVWQALFSYKKGLFVYTPLLLLVYVLGSWALWKERRFEWGSWTLFFLVLTYILSSWSNWYYGGSFSYRPFIDYYACFGILMGLGLQKVQKWQGKWLIYSLLFFLLVLNQIQIYQYRYQVIPYEGMTKETYWENFLRIDKLLKEK